MNRSIPAFLAAACLFPIAIARAEPRADNASIWTLQVENASITLGELTDRYYADGLRLGWTSPTGMVPGFLAKLGQSLWGAGQQRIAFDLSQQIYTPAGTSVAVPNPHDRPYAGYLSANFSLLSDTDTTRSMLALSLGVVGPAAGGEGLQNGFHDLIGQRGNAGWGAQIRNAPAIEVLHERIWRLPMGQVAGLETDALPALTIGLGTVRDYLQAGASVRVGRGLESDFGLPRIRPGLSGDDAFVPTRPFAWYVFAGVDAQAVGYDMLLQSSPFRAGPHVQAAWDVAEAQAGLAIMAYGARFTFTYVVQTPEQRHQAGGLHQFGSAAVSVRF